MPRFSPMRGIAKVRAPKVKMISAPKPLAAMALPKLGMMPHTGYGLAPEHPMLQSDAFHKNLKG